jgi:hypothetical protein
MPESLSELVRTVQTIRRDVDSQSKDLYKGNGKPGICTRVEVVENDIKKVCERMDKQDEVLDKHDKKLDKLMWMVAIGVGILIACQFFAPTIRGWLKSELETPIRGQINTAEADNQIANDF